MDQRPDRAGSLARAALVVGTLCAAACDAQSPDTFVQIRDSAGIRIVESTAPAWLPAERWTLSDTPVVTIGVAEGPADVQFYGIAGVVRLSDGRIAVADQGAHGIRLFAADGRFVSRSGREGSGPGEFRSLFSLGVLAKDSILVFDGSLYRFTVLDNDGQYVRTFRVDAGEELMWPVAILGSNRILVGTGRPFGGQRGSGVFADSARFLLASTDGTIVDTIGQFAVGERYVRIEGRRRTTISLPFGKEAEVAAHAGRIFVAPSDRYDVRVYGPDGRLTQIFRLPMALPEVTEAHVEQYTASRMRLQNERRRRVEARLLSEIPFPETFPAFDELLVDEEGNLWAQEYRRPGDRVATWFVLDPEGRWLGRVNAPEGLRVEQIGRDFVLGAHVDELGVERVQLYGLERPER